MFRHRRCKGTLNADLSGILWIGTPSLTMTNTGIRISITEVNERKNQGGLLLVCAKCDEVLNPRESRHREDIEVRCNVCGKHHKMQNMFSVERLPYVCGVCLKFLKRESKETPPEPVAKMMAYVELPKSLKAESLADMFEKPVYV